MWIDWLESVFAIPSLWPNGIGSGLERNRLWVRFLAVSDIYPIYIEPTITWVPSGFSGYIWLDTKIVLKKFLYIKLIDLSCKLWIGTGRVYNIVCSGSIVVTTLDSDPEVPCSSPEWVPIFYEARSTALGIPEPSSLRGSTLGTSPVEHQDSDWVWIE